MPSWIFRPNLYKRTRKLIIFYETEAPPSEYTGTGAVTTSLDSVSGTASLDFSGTGAVTTAASAGSGSGLLDFRGIASVTTAASSASGSGKQEFIGTGSVSLADSVTGTGKLEFIGTGSVTSPLDSVEGSGDNGEVTPVTGTGAVTTSSDSISGSGKLEFIGIGAVTEPINSVSASGKLEFTGTGSVTESPASITGTGKLNFTGTGSVTEALNSVSGSGKQEFIGTGSVTTALDSVSGTGAVGFTGTGAVTETKASVSGTGKLEFIGTGSVTPLKDSVSGTGTVSGTGWISPQSQIDAGFPIFIQPALAQGVYEEEVDYGSIISDVIATIDWNYELIDGPGHDITVEIRTSEDGNTWTSWIEGSTVFIASMRYLQFKLTFDYRDTDLTSLTLIKNLKLVLDVKKITDSGNIEANSGDTNGTQVNFNKIFADVESVTATVQQTVRRYVVVDFTDAPYPTGFKVYVFDSTGARTTDVVYWIARGIAGVSGGTPSNPGWYPTKDPEI